MTDRADERIVLGDGFRVDSSGHFVAEIDESAEPTGGASLTIRTGTHHPLGDVTSRTYPDCGHLYCIPASPNRTITATYEEGLLETIPGYASSISYHPNGLVSQVLHTNGVTDVEENDPSDQQRPYRLRTAGASEDFDTGVFGYAGAGNVIQMGPSRFQYDLLSRVASAEAQLEPDACAEDQHVAAKTYFGVETVETCGEITAGPAVRVLQTGIVTYRAGDRIVLGDGFRVDAGGRFVAEIDPTIEPTGGASLATWDGTYDLFGNLTAVTIDTPSTAPITHTMPVVASTNRLSGASYDLSGNVTAWAGATYRYDPFNMLRETGAHTFLYGPGDERILEIDWTGGAAAANWDETWTLRDLDGTPLRQLLDHGGNDGTGTWSFLRDYVWRGGALLATITPGGVQHFHLDHLGTPRLVTDASGNRVTYHSYLPFGEEATNPDDATIPLQYTGHERDDLDAAAPRPIWTTCISRYHSPHLGRFLSVDPVKSAQRNWPQSWNRYSYTQGNPLKFIDPDGKTVESALELIGRSAQTIVSASALTGGRVAPIEIARVLFQENRNDLNLVRGVDATQAPIGGPEAKNGGAALLFSLFGGHGSFGIAEMRTDTAAKLFGWDPANLTAEQRQQLQEVLSDPKASIMLIATYLSELKKQRPDAPTEVILSDYNRGLSTSNSVNEVGGRSGPYLSLIQEALGRGLNAGGEIEVVRCGNEYKFSNQCDP